MALLGASRKELGIDEINARIDGHHVHMDQKADYIINMLSTLTTKMDDLNKKLDYVINVLNSMSGEAKGMDEKLVSRLKEIESKLGEEIDELKLEAVSEDLHMEKLAGKGLAEQLSKSDRISDDELKIVNAISDLTGKINQLVKKRKAAKEQEEQ